MGKVEDERAFFSEGWVEPAQGGAEKGRGSRKAPLSRPSRPAARTLCRRRTGRPARL